MTFPIDGVQRAAQPQPASEGALAARPAAEIRQRKNQAVEFEAFVLQTFVDSMLPKNSEASFGGGQAGQSWRSMMAEKIASEIAAAGGIGIARLQSNTDPVSMPRDALSAAPATGAKSENLTSGAKSP